MKMRKFLCLLLFVGMVAFNLPAFAYLEGTIGNDSWEVEDGDIVPTGDYDIGESGSEVQEIFVDALTLGDAGAEDTIITFDGNTQDYHISLDDGTDDLIIGLGSAPDTTPIISMAEDQIATFAKTVVFGGGQTRTVLIPIEDVELDGTSPPAVAQVGTNGQAVFPALQFDADGGATGDDIAYIHWVVPAGYVVDSARLNVYWSFSTAEDETDEAQFDFTVNAAGEGEAMDAAGTALADQTTVVADASADNGKMFKEQYNIEVETIAVGDLVTIEVTVDESASALANSGTLDVTYFEVLWESTE